MKNIKKIFISSIIFFLIPVIAQENVSFPQKLDNKGFRHILVKVDDIYISGQPEEESFKMLKEKGVTTVINLRTEREMDNRETVPFDEKKVLADLGLKYVHIPLGGPDTPYNKEAVKKFAEAVSQAKGKILLHCTVAWRASHMWAAYLIEHKGFSTAKALEHVKAINFGNVPLEGFLGKKLIIDFE